MEEKSVDEHDTVEAVVDAAVPRRVELGKQIAVLAMVRQTEKGSLQRFLEMDTSLKISSDDVKTSDVFDLEVPSKSNEKSEQVTLDLIVEAPGFSPAAKVKSIVVNKNLDSIPTLVFLSATMIGKSEVRVKVLQSGQTVAYCVFGSECESRHSATTAHHTFKTDHYKAS